METYTRVADFDGDLGELAKAFSKGAVEVPFFRDDVRKFGFKVGEYLLMISQSQGERNPEYNFILTVTGPDIIQAHHVAMDFQERTGFQTREAPERLAKTNAMMGTIEKILKYMVQEEYFQKTF